jgi:hypothetical protein
MKTQVIQLELHDDVISTRDKMAWAKSARILLVWPAHADILNRTVDLVVLLRYSQQLGSQLGLVTKNHEIRTTATEVGIPVFDNVESANRRTWRRQRRRRCPVVKLNGSQRLQRRAKVEEFHQQVTEARLKQDRLAFLRIPAFIIAIAAVFTLGILFVPSATVRLQPKDQEQTIRMQIWTNPTIQSPSLTGSIPAYTLQTEVEGEDEIESSGSQTISDQPAMGQVVFTNLTDEAIDVPAGTVVRTLGEDPIRFETQQSVLLPAGTQSTATADVRAVNAGTNGNVGAEALTAIEGNIGVQIGVTNPEAMTGGSDRASRSPSQTDYERLRERLLEKLMKTGYSEFESRIQPNQRLLETTLSQQAVVMEERSPAEDLPGDRLHLKMRVKYQIWYYDELDLRAVTVAAMETSLPQGYRSLGTDVSLEEILKPAMKGDSVRWEVSAKRNLKPAISEDTVARAITGKTPTEVVDMLEDTYNLAESPEIELSPPRWPRFPYLPFRISVVVQ